MKRGGLIGRSFALLLVLLSLLPAGASAQDRRPLRIIIPFAAGGSSDAIARTLAERLTAVLGQPVIVEAKPGGSGLIASKHVLGQPADGENLFLTSPTVTIILPRISKLDFDPLTEFADGRLVRVRPQVVHHEVQDAPFDIGQYSWHPWLHGSPDARAASWENPS